MARKKHTMAGAAVDLLFAPVSIAVGVGKAVSDAKKGINMPPMHPNCRCTHIAA